MHRMVEHLCTHTRIPAIVLFLCLILGDEELRAFYSRPYMQTWNWDPLSSYLYEVTPFPSFGLLGCLLCMKDENACFFLLGRKM